MFDIPLPTRPLSICSLAFALAGCASFGSSGPNTGTVIQNGRTGTSSAPIKVLDLTETVALSVLAADKVGMFSDLPGSMVASERLIGPGDSLEISVWEAPPATLFGASMVETRSSVSGGSAARGTTFAEEVVDGAGIINVPFAGQVVAGKKTVSQLEREIASRLDGRAHEPQITVRLIRNAAETVTVVGEVSSSMHFPLSTRGERLLDAIAGAGGVRQPVNKTTIQLTRGPRIVSMPLDAIIRDPAQNIVLQPGDVVTAMYQPFSFTALGAVANNAEIVFEGNGFTLAQALGRVGGLRDERADIRGVFIFRFERPDVLPVEVAASSLKTPEGKIPIIYRLNLNKPESFFVAQGFSIKNKDIVYVSNAPASDLQKFTNILSSIAFSVIGLSNSLK